jgi:hypothetical protein
MREQRRWAQQSVGRALPKAEPICPTEARRAARSPSGSYELGNGRDFLYPAQCVLRFSGLWPGRRLANEGQDEFATAMTALAEKQ